MELNYQNIGIIAGISAATTILLLLAYHYYGKDKMPQLGATTIAPPTTPTV